ncbi:MAG: YajD family HNH nuclease [Arenicellales bacterium]
MPNNEKLDQIVADARRNIDQRAKGYREKSLKMYPWVCGRCARDFDNTNLSELTVHHRDHNHDNNPEDGSNWELLCVYCHDNEHSKQEDLIAAKGRVLGADGKPSSTKHNPFANLKQMMKDGG